MTMEINNDQAIEAYKNKLKNYYNEEGKLVQYPNKKPMRILALIKIAECFEPDTKYTEKQVNTLIKDNIDFTDIELIRREMFQYKFRGRLRDGSQYWREENWDKAYAEYINKDECK